MGVILARLAVLGSTGVTVVVLLARDSSGQGLSPGPNAPGSVPDPVAPEEVAEVCAVDVGGARGCREVPA